MTRALVTPKAGPRPHHPSACGHASRAGSWPLLLLAIVAMLSLSSCYHMIIATRDGVPEPDPLRLTEDFYRLKQVHAVDTVIKVGLLDQGAMLLQLCPNGFHSIEYRVRLGDALHNALTFGRKRRVWVTCVCIKETN